MGKTWNVRDVRRGKEEVKAREEGEFKKGRARSRDRKMMGKGRKEKEGDSEGEMGTDKRRKGRGGKNCGHRNISLSI